MRTAIKDDIQYQVPNEVDIPDEIDIENAEQLRAILASEIEDNKSTELSVVLNKKPGKITLAPMLAQSLLKLLELISNGKGIRMIPVEANFTTQQAADFLNVPREYLNKLLDDKEINFKQEEKHRRIKVQDLIQYKKKRDDSRSDAMKRLLAMDGKEIFGE